MTHISGFERSQLLLLPEAVDDYVGPDNPVWFIDAFVDGLDLAGAGFRRGGWHEAGIWRKGSRLGPSRTNHHRDPPRPRSLRLHHMLADERFDGGTGLGFAAAHRDEEARVVGE